MTSTRNIIQPISDFERERQIARLAAIAQAQHDTRGIIETLERSLGVTRAYPATRHALALLDAVDAMAKAPGRQA